MSIDEDVKVVRIRPIDVHKRIWKDIGRAVGVIVIIAGIVLGMRWLTKHLSYEVMGVGLLIGFIVWCYVMCYLEIKEKMEKNNREKLKVDENIKDITREYEAHTTEDNR